MLITGPRPAAKMAAMARARTESATKNLATSKAGETLLTFLDIFKDFKGSTESTVCRVDVHWMNIGWNYRIKSKAYADETLGK